MAVQKTHPQKMKTPNRIINWTCIRIGKNKNAIILICGETGGGKTYAAIELGLECAEVWNSNFTMKDNVAFDFKSLLKKTKLPQNINKPGTAYIFEEVGAVGSGASSRAWQTKLNKFFVTFMQTARHKNQILIMTTPVFGFLDRGVRVLCHMLMQTSHINFRTRQSYVIPYEGQVNAKTGKEYWKKLRYIKDGRKHRLDFQGIRHPPQDMVDEYEIMKTEFTKSLEKDILKGNKEVISKPKCKIDGIDESRYQFYVDKGYKMKRIAELEGVSLSTVKRFKLKFKNRPKNEQIGQIPIEKQGFDPVQPIIPPL